MKNEDIKKGFTETSQTLKVSLPLSHFKSAVYIINSEHLSTSSCFISPCPLSDVLPHQEACLQGNLIANCLEQLSDPHPLLRQWVAICLGRIWQNFDPARWCGVRDSAHEKLYTLLSDPIPEVRG